MPSCQPVHWFVQASGFHEYPTRYQLWPASAPVRMGADTGAHRSSSRGVEPGTRAGGRRGGVLLPGARPEQLLRVGAEVQITGLDDTPLLELIVKGE